MARGANGLAVQRWPVEGAPRLVVVHGSMDRSASFRKLVRRLPEVDCTLYDRRGYGASRALEAAPSIEGQVDDLLEVIDGPTTTVFGHSFGGVIALAAAARQPELFRSMVVYEAPQPWLEWWPKESAGGRAVSRHLDDPPAAAEAFMRRMIGDERWERLPLSTRTARREEGTALLAEMVAVRRRPPPYEPGDISVPVLAVRGSDSQAHHRRAAAELATHVAGAGLIEIDGAGHGAHLSHPDALAEIIRDALAGPEQVRS